MTLGLGHKDCKTIWKWLSKHSDPNLLGSKNKIKAMKTLKITLIEYEAYNFCPYCKFAGVTTGNATERGCKKCSIVKRYKKSCKDIGYREWSDFRTPENALAFYNNIKNL